LRTEFEDGHLSRDLVLTYSYVRMYVCMYVLLLLLFELFVINYIYQQMLIKCTKLQAVSLPHASADVRLLSGRRYYKGIYTSI